MFARIFRGLRSGDERDRMKCDAVYLTYLTGPHWSRADRLIAQRQELSLLPLPEVAAR
jgi:hypothetical protein